ncbi:Cytosolic sulfotransferase 17 [Camellia lanceoleosa]|uniref:Cytosolic sulfotransferase 17 n=2 Tax=Camellia lanceoleosa TaxID=1840588 RepID=A0ACC0F9F8_9ERIC|nr:Cytosolic sulfotransferase 17 [Camellia lanceoleosa]KAI7985839.1 Cytosolic sulfotransferase 17 [Camellia lanceoleosa]
MATFPLTKQAYISKTNDEKEEYKETYQKYNEMVQTLPKGKGWMSQHVLQYQGFWFNPDIGLKGAMLVQNHFKPRPTDIFLAAFIKCGTTWLRTLMFATMNRSLHDFSSHPLLNTGPHGCFPCLDTHNFSDCPISDLEAIPSPRLLATHIPYPLLPESVIASGCKFVYIWRDPKDVLVSMWYFLNKLKPKEQPPLSLDEAFDLFCEGIADYGPFWDHVLGYWKASQESPDKILFLRYEDLKREPSVYLKRLAVFLGQPFTIEEEREDVVQKIAKFCSFENLSNLEINKCGVQQFNRELAVENSNYFRKGQVGDSKNHLTSNMIEHIDHIMKQKFNGSGLISDELLTS